MFKTYKKEFITEAALYLLAALSTPHGEWRNGNGESKPPQYAGQTLMSPDAAVEEAINRSGDSLQLIPAGCTRYKK